MKGGKNRQPLTVRQLHGGKSPVSGYTIIEVMIVLAVSGVMFLIAASFINGKQARTAFTQGVNQTASNIQDVIEQVNDGKYSDIPFTCSNGNPPSFTGTIPTLANQGTNAPCVFLGKLFYFQQGTSSDYYVFSLAGNRLTASNKPAVAFTDLQPVPVWGNSIDLTTTNTIAQSLNVQDIKINGSTTAYNFGFMQSPGSLDASDATNSTYSSGAQAITLIYTPSLNSAGIQENTAIPDIRANASNYSTINSVSLCLTDSTRYASLDIGVNNNGQMSVNVAMKGSTPC